MQFYSTRNRKEQVSLREAVLQGLASDGGLYMPANVPRLNDQFFHSISEKSFLELSFEVAHSFVGEDVPEPELRKIVHSTLQFGAPLVELHRNIFALELFHGPTLAFKDFGARFLSGLVGYFAGERQREITILVATSGDTGSAVANAFLDVPGTRVIVLYPSGKVSELQEKQFTTLGSNTTALELDGTFDDCQKLVKQAFLDEELKKKLTLTSANSINIGRLIPQTFYYFHAYAGWKKTQLKNQELVFSVPSGNFGNLTAGLIAKKMGLPLKRFIAATNINAVVPDYLKTGLFFPASSVPTISNAMDVGDPSNFQRMLDLYDHDFAKLSRDVLGYSFSDNDTREAMKHVALNGYVLDPHGAVGYLGLKKYFTENPGNTAGIFLETAHPGKFKEVVEETLQQKLELPDQLRKFLTAKKRSQKMPNNFTDFKSYLLQP